MGQRHRRGADDDAGEVAVQRVQVVQPAFVRAVLLQPFMQQAQFGVGQRLLEHVGIELEFRHGAAALADPDEQAAERDEDGAPQQGPEAAQ